MFVYRFDEIFSTTELDTHNLENLPVLKKQVALAINRRLRIREIPDVLDLESKQRRIGDRGNQSLDTQPKTRLIAFFLDEKQLNELPPNPTQKMDILEGRKQFDMRRLHSFALLEPEVKVLPTARDADNSMQIVKSNLIYQFEKDDLLFEVFEIVNPPEQISIRLKIYDS